jgi:hypothetical protein
MRFKNACAVVTFALASVAAPGSRTGNLVREARADDADVGLATLKCFHPTADFIRMNLGPRHEDSSGRTAADGRVDFRGGFSGKAYYMEFVMHFREHNGDSEIRVTPVTDTAPFPPSPTCALRDWTRVN